MGRFKFFWLVLLGFFFLVGWDVVVDALDACESLWRAWLDWVCVCKWSVTCLWLIFFLKFFFGGGAGL
jgi:hypothetical protein